MGKRLEVARHAQLDAEETVRLLGRRFENSLATMSELLDAQTALNQARSNLVENEGDYALAGGRVYYRAGIFLKEMLK
jgi:outer membrane protein TolC